MTTRIANAAMIQACLRAYLNARCEHELILKDAEVQHWFAVGNDTEANRLIEQRYPFGKWEQVHEYAIALLREMYRMTPHTFDVEGIWRRPDLFKRALLIAARS